MSIRKLGTKLYEDLEYIKGQKDLLVNVALDQLRYDFVSLRMEFDLSQKKAEADIVGPYFIDTLSNTTADTFPKEMGVWNASTKRLVMP